MGIRSAQREYDAEAAQYDARWAAYTRDSLALLRPSLASTPPGRLLDVGCGTAQLVIALAAWRATPTRYVGVDVSTAMLRVAREKTEAAPFPCALAVASADALPHPARSFHTVVSASSLHGWPHVDRGLTELRRVLRPGGRVVLVDWCADHLPVRGVALWLRLVRGRRVRPLRLTELTERVRAAGFAVVREERARISPVWGMMVVEATAAWPRPHRSCFDGEVADGARRAEGDVPRWCGETRSAE